METILGVDCGQTVFAVSESTQVAAVRRAASDLASRLGFGATGVGQAALAATEAATNIVKHAGRGEVVLRAVMQGPHAGIELLAIDRGPGMANLAGSMLDGASTAGTYGVGLGAMRRLSQEFDIYTAPGKGTVVGMVLWAGARQPEREAAAYGVVALPLPGEPVCGDSWSLALGATSATVLMADGLGHGPAAALASQTAAAVLSTRPEMPPGALLEEAHAALRATRGAAMAVASIDMLSEQLRYAGIGNIAAHVYERDGTQRRQMVSHNGIVGSNMRKVQEFSTPWSPGAVLVMHSDGLQSRWDLGDYPGLLGCHPRVIAALLYRDFLRGRDDVSVLVLRDSQE